MTEYEYEYYSAFQKWPNTNMNIIWLCKIYEYEYKYYSAFQKWPNTNIIRLSKNDQIRIRILFSFPKKFIIWSLKRTVGKRKTNATIASMQSIKQETWGRRWKRSGEKLNQCIQCDLKRHSGDKSNKCNQCNFASTWPANLRTHLKSHSGEKSIDATSVIMHPLEQATWGTTW